MAKRQAGFTLLEIIVVMAILSLLMAAVFGFFELALKSFSLAEARVACHQAANNILDKMQYGYTTKQTEISSGIERAFHISAASYESLTFTPPCSIMLADADPTNKSTPDSLDSLQFVVEPPQFKVFQAGSSPPSIVLKRNTQVKIATTRFDYSTRLLSIVDKTFADITGFEITASYLPSLLDEPTSSKTISWESTKVVPGSTKSSKPRLVLKYYTSAQKLASKPYAALNGVTIDSFHFNYYDRSGLEIPLKEGESLSQEQIYSLTAIELCLNVSKGNYITQFRRFIQCRGLGHSILVTADNSGQELLTLPSSTDISVLSLGNIDGVQKDSKITVEAGNWKAEIIFNDEAAGVVYYSINSKRDQTKENGENVDLARNVRREFGINLLSPDVVLTDGKNKNLTKEQLSKLVKIGEPLQGFGNTSRLYFADSNGDTVYNLGEQIMLKSQLSETDPRTASFVPNQDRVVYALPSDGRKPTEMTWTQISMTPRLLYYDKNLNREYDEGEAVVCDLNIDSHFAGSFYDMSNQTDVKVSVTLENVDGVSLFVEGKYK